MEKRCGCMGRVNTFPSIIPHDAEPALETVAVYCVWGEDEG